MKLVLFGMLLFTRLISASNEYLEDYEKFCQNQLNQRIVNLISDDKNIVAKLYEASQLKLAIKLVEQDRHQTLEGLLKEKMSSVPADKRKLVEGEISKIFSEYGELPNSFQVNQISEDLQNANYAKNRLTGIKTSVAIRLLRKIDNESCQGELCLNRNDEAIHWLIGTIRDHKITGKSAKENLLDTSVIIANYSGAIHENMTLDREQAIKKITNIQQEISNELDALLSKLLIDYQQCDGIFGNITCSRQIVKSSLEQEIKKLITVAKQTDDIKIAESGELILADIKLHFGIDSKILTKKKTRSIPESGKKIFDFSLVGNSVESSSSTQEPNMCGGVPFRSSTRNKEVWGVMDPRGGVESAKNATQDKKFKDIFSKFHVPGPGFRCSTEGPLKPPRLGMMSAEKLVCCNEQQSWEKLQRFFISVGGGVSCRLFIGLPYIAELGIKFGAGINLYGSGGRDPVQCDDIACGYITVSLDVSAGIYGEVLAGAASVQGTISWLPYAMIEQCLSKDGRNHPHAELSYQIGRIVGIFNVRLGWAFSYSTTKEIYTDETTHNLPVAIF